MPNSTVLDLVYACHAGKSVSHEQISELAWDRGLGLGFCAELKYADGLYIELVNESALSSDAHRMAGALMVRFGPDDDGQERSETFGWGSLPAGRP